MRWWERGLAAALVLGVLLLAGVWLFQRQFGVLLFDRTAAQRVGRDVTAGLPDGLHVLLCGTGSPLPDPTRAGPCTVVIAGRHVFVVDAGEGGARNMALMGVPMGRIERLFLTHFHSDHIDGLGPMMLLRWTGASAHSPLPVAGPPGVEQVVSGFDAAYALDNGYRIAHHGPAVVPPEGAGAAALPFPLPGAGRLVLSEDGVKVRAFTVDHGPVRPAVGYRFDYKGRSVVVSGDTAYSPVLVQAALGADLLVHEALQPKLLAAITKALEARGQANTARITRDIVNYHATPEQAADAAHRAGVRALVLNHIVPPLPMRFLGAAFLGDARAHFSGPITVGEDGMMISLPVGSAAVEQRKLL